MWAFVLLSAKKTFSLSLLYLSTTVPLVVDSALNSFSVPAAYEDSRGQKTLPRREKSHICSEKDAVERDRLQFLPAASDHYKIIKMP